MFARLFLDHPRQVEETYFEHMGVAARFGFAMIWGGLKALIHAVFPAWCETSGSDTIRRLHARIVRHRNGKRDAATVEWVI